MGYESKITVIYKGYTMPNGDTYGETIMTINMSKMGGFGNLFKNTIGDYNLYYYLDDGNTKVDRNFEDPYGDTPKVAGLKDTLAWLKADMDRQKANGEQVYRREKTLYNALKTFNTKAWDSENIIIVHTGY